MTVRPDHGMRLLGFAVSAAYWPGLLSAVFVPRWAAIAIGLPLASKLDPRRVDPWLLILLATLVGICALSLISSPDPLGGALDLIYVALLCGVFLAGANLVRLDDAMAGLTVGLAVSSALCIGQVFGLSPVPQIVAPAGLFFNREVLAEFSAIVLVWAIVRRHIPFALIAAIPVALCLSRIAMLTVAIGLLFAYWPRTWAWRIGAVALLCVVAFVATVAMGGGKAFSADHRLIVWGATAMAISPLGHGLGWFNAAHPPEQFAHSDALQILAELGIAGLLLAVIPVAALWRHRGDHDRSDYNRSDLAERAAFVTVCAQVLVSFPLHFPASGFLAALLAGYLARRRGDVCVGASVGGMDDATGVQRRDARHLGAGRAGRQGGATVSARSLLAAGAALCARGNRAAAGASA